MFTRIYDYEVRFDEDSHKVESITTGEGVNYRAVNLYKFDKACNAYVKQDGYTLEHLKNCLYNNRGILR